jgi:hypothetical protein
MGDAFKQFAASVDTSRPVQEMGRLEKAADATLSLMTRPLAEFSRQHLQLHYTAASLGVATEQLQRMTLAGQALGVSQEQEAAREGFAT